MKKVYTIIPLLALLSLSACQKESTATEREYQVVEFNYNYKDTDDVYQSSVVYHDKNLSKPVIPTRDQYVFSYWSLDKEGNEPYTEFGKPVTKDLNLYAQWDLYSEMTDLDKINRFYEYLSDLETFTSATTVDVNQTFLQNVTSGQQVMYFAQHNEYNRYTDITEQRIYSYPENEGDDNVLEFRTQYTHDDNKYYRLAYDENINGSDESFRQEADYNPDTLDSFLDITFKNLYLSKMTALKTKLEKNTPIGDAFYYELNLDLTKFNPRSGSFEFSLVYYTSVTDDKSSLTLEDRTDFTATLVFVNNKFVQSSVEDVNVNAINGEIQIMNTYEELAQYTRVESLSEFTGDRFDPSDFPLKTTATA